MQPLQIRVRAPFDADRRRGAVAGVHPHLIGKGQELCPDALEQHLLVSAWQVPSTDAARKDEIAAQENLLVPVQQNARAGRVPGRVENLELEFAGTNLFALLVQEIRLMLSKRYAN